MMSKFFFKSVDKWEPEQEEQKEEQQFRYERLTPITITACRKDTTMA